MFIKLEFSASVTISFIPKKQNNAYHELFLLFDYHANFLNKNQKY